MKTKKIKLRKFQESYIEVILIDEKRQCMSSEVFESLGFEPDLERQCLCFDGDFECIFLVESNLF